MELTCKNCNHSKDAGHFYKNNIAKTGYQSVCKDCKRLLDQRIREEKRQGIYESKCRQPRLTEEDRLERKEFYREYQRNYRKENAEQIARGKREYRHKLRADGLAEYGTQCTCCGESDIHFLTLEHINGRKQEEKGLTGAKMWAYLKRLGWPKEGYTVLCFNCNCAKGIYGTCPHQRRDKDVKQNSSGELL